MSIKQRLYPDSSQELLLINHCNQARLIYNLGLEQRKLLSKEYRGRGYKVTYNSQAKELTELRKEFDWLRAGASTVQQGALRDLDRAFTNFFAGRSRYPKYKKRGVDHSFVVRDVVIKRYNRRWASCLIPKIGYVRFRISRNWSELSAASSARVTYVNGQWHISFTALPPDKKVTGITTIGIDLGVKITAALSNGTSYYAPQNSRDIARYAALQQKLAKQTKGSHRYNKTLTKLARLRQRRSNVITDWLEKTTTAIANQYHTVFVENLKLHNLTKRNQPKPDPDNPGQYLPNGQRAKTGLARALLSVPLSKFVTRLSDKTDVIKVNPAYTSKRCYVCGYTHPDNRDSQAIFKCIVCGHNDNADINAAKNIEYLGLNPSIKALTLTPHIGSNSPRDTGLNGQDVANTTECQPTGNCL